jgi:secondary thiamine-phosphate synthase enzyme
MIKEIAIKTTKNNEVIDITSKVQKIVEESKIKQGFAIIYVKHATCAITINENYDPNICTDLLNSLNKLIPEGVWLHDKIDNNAAAHIKSAIIGPSELIPIKDGKLTLGTWQNIILMDLDGPRQRKVIIK